MIKNNLKTMMVAGMVFLSLGGSVSTFATSLSTTDLVSTSKQAIEQELYIHNGNFDAGFDRWIVSDPATNNPTLQTVNGNNFALAKNGENVHQYVTLKPNTTYTFSYDVAASESSPGRVELGIMTHGVGFDVLERSEHNNEDWERGKLTFTTPDAENTYLVRFASTWNGWATYDNIEVTTESDVTETRLLSVGREGSRALAYLTLTPERFNSRERLMVTVNGRYLFETYNGTNYYSSRRTVDGNIQVRQTIAGTSGQVIRVYRVPGHPGQSTTGRVLLESLTLDTDI
ncbi:MULTISPECIES: carbohydrate binding domain-containing protein [Enterococcus]|uniref:CBM-cenC domain-containing protein n=1 Tax=Candidatus Enterococcus mangumiae TaxID=2230878 RepID=A0ABZ2SX34_9ENTE|nr:MULTISPECIES: carbohydrate binding domain-containing protein [unclassified Enterococcus]MBO0461548.1 carbohydrate binding domain-containing protein [Enterococcus sp. DIV1298c]MBO0489279.1 carbohydrate binding domain-containing protein [Enterococcus sp. DIV1094]MBO1300006.1 carbohydrate binding domain-containing protein [Enterococcus sp. DIV1271a]